MPDVELLDVESETDDEELDRVAAARSFLSRVGAPAPEPPSRLDAAREFLSQVAVKPPTLPPQPEVQQGVPERIGSAIGTKARDIGQTVSDIYQAPERFGRGFVRGFKHPVTATDIPGHVAEALGRPFVGAFTGAVDAGLMSPETAQRLGEALVATTPMIGAPMPRFGQALRYFGAGGAKAPIITTPAPLGPASIAREFYARKPVAAIPAKTGPTVGGPSRTFAVGPSQAAQEGAVVGPRATATYPPASYALPRVQDYPTYVPPGAGTERIGRFGYTRRTPTGEPSATRPDLQTAVDVGMERAASIPRTEGEIPAPSEVFRNMRQGRPLDEMPTATEIGQARAVTVIEGERPVVPTTGGATQPGEVPRTLTNVGPRFDWFAREFESPTGPPIISPGKVTALVDKTTGRVIAYSNDAGELFSSRTPPGAVPSGFGTQRGATGSPPVNPPPPGPGQAQSAAAPWPMPPGAAPRFGAGGGAPPPPPGPSPVFNPNIPPNQIPYLTFFGRLKRWYNKRKEGLPAENLIWRKVPDSPVITGHMHMERRQQDAAFATFKSDHASILHKGDPRDIMWRADLATNRFNQRMADLGIDVDALSARAKATGRPIDPAIMQIIDRETAAAIAAHYTPEMQAAAAARAQTKILADRYSMYFRAEPIPEHLGPYWPRMVDWDAQELWRVRRGQGLGGHMRSNVGAFERGRKFRTHGEGVASGVDYLDPRKSWAYREWADITLIETGRYFEFLEVNGVIFRTPEAALARGVTGRLQRLEGAPGTATWWVRTPEEALFLKQALETQWSNTFAHLMNTWFRGPNLINPFPHAIKNMFFKFVMARGFPFKAMRDIREWAAQSDPVMLRLFDRYMPYSTHVHPADAYFSAFVKRDILSKAGRTAGLLNLLSGHMTFNIADPALRYALFKDYLRRGFAPQAAANHVTVDLIRYSMRGDLLAYWKGWPGNFFAPWRLGTVLSFVKQVRTHPIRTAMFIGVVDYLREIRYRQDGRWTHLPIDYFEGPIAMMLEKRDAATITSVLATTAMFGPGGAFGAATLAHILQNISDPNEKIRFVNMFWGIAQLYNGATEFNDFMRTGDVKYLANLITLAAIGEHSVYYKPFRMFGALESFGLDISSLPGMKKSPRVLYIEGYRDMQQKRHEQLEQRREQQGDIRTLRRRTERVFGP